MGTDVIINAIVGLTGALTGAGTMYVIFRKMPGDIGNTESQTVKNLLDSNKLLSEQLRTQQTEISELRAWFTGGIEIITRLELSNPPKILAATVKRVPIAPDIG